jgi:hypothetical protein
MRTLSLQLHTMNRDIDGMSDAGVGEMLVGMVEAALQKGRPPAVATILRADRVDILGLKPIVDAKIPVNLFLAALTRAEVGPELGDAGAIGVMGTVRVRGAPMAIAFLEWPDNRWWLWRSLLDAEGAPIPDTETRTCAVDGDALPPGFGRWWSLGRRRNLRLSMRRAQDGTPVPVSRHVH